MLKLFTTTHLSDQCIVKFYRQGLYVKIVDKMFGVHFCSSASVKIKSWLFVSMIDKRQRSRCLCHLRYHRHPQSHFNLLPRKECQLCCRTVYLGCNQFCTTSSRWFQGCCVRLTIPMCIEMKLH